MKIGLALSGGGIRGIAHAGVIKALEEENIQIDIIGGTSSGSLIASLYAMGYSPYYIYVLFKRYSKSIVEIDSKPILSGIGNFMFAKKVNVTGLKTGESIEKAYNELALKKGIKKIGEISMPLVIPAVDIYSSKEYVFTSKKTESEENQNQYITDISIGKAVRASSSFPIVFSPCEYKSYSFLDGGVLDNTPVHEVKKQGADKVLAITFESDGVTKNSNIMDIGMKILDIMGAKISEENIEMADEILTVPSDGTGLLETEKLDYCYQSGYKTAVQNMARIKKALL